MTSTSSFSSDSTCDLAVRYGARVVEIPWMDDLAAARSEGLRHASGDWIFWMDADDRLDADNRQRLRELFVGLKDENVAYVMKCLCLPDPVSATATVVDHIRLFRRHADIRWQYRVHEQILPAIRRLDGNVRWSEIVIQHTGYVDAALRRRKPERDLRLLRLEDTDYPDDPFTLFNLGSVYQELQQPDVALPLLRRGLERSHRSDSIVRKLHALIVQCHRQMGQALGALTACRSGRSDYPDDAELLFQEALILRDLGDRSGAEAALEDVLTLDPGHARALRNLAILRQQQGRAAE